MTTADEQDITAESETQDTPKIGEKVRFWEEQDRINKELIPRVVKQHQLFTAHVQGTRGYSSSHGCTGRAHFRRSW